MSTIKLIKNNMTAKGKKKYASKLYAMYSNLNSDGNIYVYISLIS